MAYFRKLPSGKWQATIRGADGKKHTKTDPLRKVVKDWATEEEVKVAAGRWRNPRLGKQTVAEWSQRWWDGRVVEDSTRRGDRSVLDNHVLPHWRQWRMNVITSLDVQQWIRAMQKADVGRHAVRRSVNLFATMMTHAVKAGVLAESPCQGITRPATPRKLPAWFTREDVDRIRAELERPTRRSPRGKAGRPHPSHSVMVELMCIVGPRWGEAAAVCGGPRADGNPVDWLRGRIRIIGTLTQDGRWKEYPKNPGGQDEVKSRREVPVPRYILDMMAPLLVGRDSHGYVFVTDRGQRPLSGPNWRRVWYEAIDAINATTKTPVPRLDPHDCRHTAASWLRQEGVDLGDIQQLLGHESAQTTQRYAHLSPSTFRAVEDAWSRIVAHVRRIGRRKADGHGS